MNPSSLTGHMLELLGRINNNHHPPDRIVSDFFRSRTYLGSHDRRVIAESVFNLLRYRRGAEALLQQFAKTSGKEFTEGPGRLIPLLAASGIIHPPEAPPFQIPRSVWVEKLPDLDMEVFLSWIRAHGGFDFLDKDDPETLGVRYSFQDWMVGEWEARYGAGTEGLLHELNAPAPVTLRVNFSRATREECRSRLQGEGIESEPTRLSPAGLTAMRRFSVGSSQTFKDGWFEIQDEGSQVVSLVADPSPGETVIDSCAGTGGKSLHLADLMRHSGEILSLDIDPHRLEELGRRARRQGASIVKAMRQVEPDKLADAVLVDAPCSGSGTIRRNPALKWIPESLVDRSAARQREILARSARFVKPGGRIVYATCSLFKRENEDVVEHFLSGNPDFFADTSESTLFPGRPDVTLLPHIHGTDGFFISRMRRRSLTPQESNENISREDL